MAKKILVIGSTAPMVGWLRSRFTVYTCDSAEQVLNNKFLLDEADCILYTGGADICPSWYGHKKHPRTQTMPTDDREQHESTLYYHAVSDNVPFIGICRGAQFLSVLNGATLLQDVDNHTTDHDIVTVDGRTFKSTSTHHQMVDVRHLPEDEYELVAYAKNVSRRAEKMAPKDSETNHSITVIGLEKEPEIISFPKMNTLCIQGHPEFTNANIKYKEYCLDLIEETMEQQ